MIAPVLPTVSDLEPWISKLEQHPGSIVLLASESFQTRNDSRVTVGWLSPEERMALRAALLRRRRNETQRAAEIIDNATHVRAGKAPALYTVS